jgi:hypothetical protein
MTQVFNQQTWCTQFVIAILDRAELQYYLSVAEVDLLTDADLADIAQIMMRGLEESGFWKQCAFIARSKLAEHQHQRTGAHPDSKESQVLSGGDNV